jgi:hypothetical protein
MERRLAAILAGDVVGYSRLMGEDEASTLTAIQTGFRQGKHRYAKLGARKEQSHRSALCR